MENFKCKVCDKDKPLEDSVSLESQICVTCFTSIQIHKRNLKKIEFYKDVLKEENQHTPIRKNKIKIIEKMNDIFSFQRADILQISQNDVNYYIEEFAKQKTIRSLRFWKGKYIVREYEKDYFDLDRMKRTIGTYKRKINASNRTKIKFKRFVNIIGRESQFKVLKNMLLTKLIEFVKTDDSEEFAKLKQFIFKGVEEYYEEGLIPNISLFFHDNYERLFSTLFTKILPFDIRRISFSYPRVNSRTDFGLTFFYRYNAIELHAIEDAIKRHCNDKKTKLNQVCKFLFLNNIKTITLILDDLLLHYYKILKIHSSVRSIVNVLNSNQKTTKRYNEVYYKIHMREW
ncbi:MAG: hypothetical protein GF364_02805 [Candidatus Lokiarchaeota archaeon]|nr:hypothetical protein [Candidatus Lokiarchaeota archaeon]